jgi:acyl-CoA thioester hydrolase
MPAFEHRLRARYHECDPQGIVFNANHIAYVDVALTELWRAAFGSYEEMGELGFDMLVADVHASFRRPVAFDAEVVLSLTIERFGRTSMTTHWVTSVDGEVCVEGEIVHVWIDRTTSEPAEIPTGAREALAPYATA